MPVFALLAYFFFGPNFFTKQQMLLIATQVVVLLIFIPVLIFFLMRMLGKVDSIMLREISQRRVPLFIHAILLYILVKNGITIDVAFELYFFFLGALISTIIAFSLSILKFKISLHMLGISAVTVFLIGLSIHSEVNAIRETAALVFVNGVIFSSRLQMKAHTILELIVGFVMGIAPQIALWHFWL